MPVRRNRKISAQHHKDLVKISFRISRKDHEAILALVRSGTYSSVSEFVRHALERLVYEYSDRASRR
ncbi:MAG: ribbon-helix-helix domain-containing protein [Thermofilum sp.]